MYVELYSEILNPDHELLQAARVIDWDGLEKALRSFYSPLGRQVIWSSKNGHPVKPL